MKREATYYMLPEYPVTIVEDLEEGGYTITLPDCPGCVTCCQRWEDIPATIADAQREWMEAVTENATPPAEEAIKSGVPIPEPPREEKYDLPTEISDAIDKGNCLLEQAEENA